MLKTLNPIFFREIYALPRRKYFYLKRMAMVTLPLVFVLGEFFDSGSNISGLSIFRFYAPFSLITLVFFSILVTLPLISKEKDDNTLILLLLTKMSPRKIVWGKFAGSFFFVCMVYAAFLPLGILAIGMGGISAPQIGAIFILTLSSIALSIAFTIPVAIFFSSRISFLMVGIGLFFYDEVMRSLELSFSPLEAISVCLTKGTVNSCYSSTLFQLTLMFFLLIFSSYLLSTKGLSKKKFSWRKIFRREKNPSQISSSSKPFSPITKNPIYWRDYHQVYGFHKLKWTLCSFLLIPIFSGDLEFLAGAWGTLISLAMFIILYQCLNAFLRERQNKVWELLLLTGLSEKEIYWGKVKAIFYSNLPFFIATLASCLVVLSEESDFLIPLLIGLVFLLVQLFILYSIATFLSLSKDSLVKAFCWFLFYGFIIYSINIAVFVSSFSVGDAAFIAPIILYIFWIWLYIYLTQRKIRNYFNTKK